MSPTHPMSRPVVAVGLCLLCVLCLFVTVVAADTPAGGAAAVPPPGCKVVFDGNSWSNFVPGGVGDLAKAAGIEGHESLRWMGGRDLGLFKDGKVDVYANGVHWWMEAPWGNAEQLVAAGLEGNPKFKAYYHAAWLVGDGRSSEIKTVEDYDTSSIADVRARLAKNCLHTEKIVDRLNEKSGKRVVFLVPVGESTLRLREAIVAGGYPGLTRQSQIWSDAMPHAGPHVMALSGYCHFAAIYGISPVGLKLARFQELTDEQHAILQRIAWDVVSKYPHAGIAAFRKAEETPASR